MVSGSGCVPTGCPPPPLSLGLAAGRSAAGSAGGEGRAVPHEPPAPSPPGKPPPLALSPPAFRASPFFSRRAPPRRPALTEPSSRRAGGSESRLRPAAAPRAGREQRGCARPRCPHPQPSHMGRRLAARLLRSCRSASLFPGRRAGAEGSRKRRGRHGPARLRSALLRSALHTHRQRAAHGGARPSVDGAASGHEP